SQSSSWLCVGCGIASRNSLDLHFRHATIVSHEDTSYRCPLSSGAQDNLEGPPSGFAEIDPRRSTQHLPGRLTMDSPVLTAAIENAPTTKRSLIGRLVPKCRLGLVSVGLVCGFVLSGMSLFAYRALSRPRHSVNALVHIARGPPSVLSPPPGSQVEDEAEFEHYLQTQAALINTPLALNTPPGL